MAIRRHLSAAVLAVTLLLGVGDVAVMATAATSQQTARAQRRAAQNGTSRTTSRGATVTRGTTVSRGTTAVRGTAGGTTERYQQMLAQKQQQLLEVNKQIQGELNRYRNSTPAKAKAGIQSNVKLSRLQSQQKRLQKEIKELKRKIRG